jgi:hypothetical protein
MPLFNYVCKCDKHVKELLVDKHDEIVLCECGRPMAKMVGAASLGGMDKIGRSK